MADMKSIILNPGADDVINQILHNHPLPHPVEGSTWISQTIYPKLQENWLQILERRQKKGEKKNKVEMIHRAFIH